MPHWITLDTAAGPVQGWLAEPEGAPRGGLVVVQEIFGANAHIRDVTERFAAEGYLAIAPAFFDPVEKGVVLDYSPESFAKGRELVGQLGFDKALQIVEAAAKQVSGAGKVGVIGYCWGGSVALLAALRLGLPASSYYGARNLPFLGETPKAPVIFHFGEKDKSIPGEAVQQHRERFGDAVFTYPAGHAFNRDVDVHAYDEASAKLALQRTLDFFAEQLQ